MNFAGIGQISTETGGFDCVLADLGVSSMQLDNPERGFSCKLDGPLNLRLNQQKGEAAATFLQSTDEKTLANILAENADEPHAALIAREVCRNSGAIKTTRQLADVVAHALYHPKPDAAEVKKAQQRTFMALRIAVNDEFGVLDRFLELLPWCLRESGRVAILSFHSGEDRRVKKSFQKFYRSGIYSLVAPGPIRPSAEERRSNPRSICAKLRWAVRSALPIVQE